MYLTLFATNWYIRFVVWYKTCIDIMISVTLKFLRYHQRRTHLSVSVAFGRKHWMCNWILYVFENGRIAVARLILRSWNCSVLKCSPCYGRRCPNRVWKGWTETSDWLSRGWVSTSLQQV